MFDSVLVANRGEVAVRIVRACRELGVRSIVLASEPDRDALHARMADDIYLLEGASPADTYLNTAALRKAISQTAADAVHPGYGFLSENADFARLVTESGAAFIGPPAAAIDLMGSKISARNAAERAGVAGVPGLSGAVSDRERVEEFAEQYGFPIAIKASFGGGGRGMRVVASAADIDEALESSQREALAYFGNGEVYLEKYLQRPRHIEIQILADTHGHCIWLGERDCSVQRRHQKLIEETPALGLSDTTLEAMGQASVAIAREVGYVNAGTLEFLYEDGDFWFLEMNTRLQVEHPVTEMVTGVDIVTEQIRIAAGEKLSLSQGDRHINGHAIEMRINAEDPSGGRFAPTPGTVTALDAPISDVVRFDAGYESGDTVSQYYDSLLGKLVVHADTRDDAIKLALATLDDFTVEGVSSTVPAHRLILEHPDFQAGTHHTNWLETTIEFPESFDEPAEDRSLVWINNRALWIPVFGAASGVAAEGGAGSAPPIAAVRERAGAQVEGSGIITAPLQGTVVKVLVTEGDQVVPGDVLCVLEAMKMENQIKANKTGTVTDLAVEVGASIGPGTTILTIQ